MIQKQNFKFNSKQYADLLSHAVIWIEKINKADNIDKVIFYQLGFLDNIIKKLQKAGTQANYNVNRQSQISFSIFEIDTILSLANLFNAQNYIITQIQLSLPEELIELNIKN